MIDSHMHFTRDLGTEAFMQVLRGLDGAALLSIPKSMQRAANEDIFAFRDACRRAGLETELYLFGGFDPNIYQLAPDLTSRCLVNETDRLLREGCCGIKLLEGKPNAKKNWHVPDFDTPVWEPFWQKAEEEQIPVIMHVNDPQEFWETPKDISPQELAFRVRSGWMYDGSFPNNEEQYRQLLTVLQRHPNLRILFPHFFFLSGQLERLADILSHYPQVMTDVTPGIELFLQLSDHIEEARSFFHRFAGRICYGTDIGARQVIYEKDIPLNERQTAARIHLVRGFLEARQDYTLLPDDYYRGPSPHAMHALNLTTEELSRIEGLNFLRFIRRTPAAD